MGFWRLSRTWVGVLLCAALASTAFPAATAAQDGPRRTYIVTLDVPQAPTALRATSRRAARQQLRSRRAANREATRRVIDAHGVTPRHRYSAALSGFSARLTAAEAAELRRNDEVASVRVARRIRVAAQEVPPGIQRVKAAPDGGPPGPDVDVDIAIVDTGIGPVVGDELNIAGGVDCVDFAEDPKDDGSHADADMSTPSHGTHVAGIAAARDNDIGVVGVAPGARLWSVRVFDSGARGDEATLLCGLDWILDTQLMPGEQRVDVVNMSLEAARLPFDESCSPGDPLDPVHDYVCALDALGVVVVAAAGNQARNASAVIPAAYNQVITVGAINDYDGQSGGQGSAPCVPSGPDDRYARFSNYGRDVDIVAPGSCVRSLGRDGGALTMRRISGTSQATPHVSGAVARYLAAHPDTVPAQVRRLVRVSGRLDWAITSDPDWSGPADSDAPKRLLDVAAMAAGDGLRVWLSASGFKVGKRETAREARVDVQRLGGFAGDVALSLSGLPEAVGRASFDGPGADIGGGLGARLKLKLALDGPQGPQDLLVEAQGSGGDPAGSRELSLLVDRRPPRITDLGARILPRTTVSDKGAAIARMRWQVSDAHSKVTSAVLQRRDSSGRWRSLKGKLEQARVTFKPRQAARFRVRAVDARGNARVSAPLSISMGVRDASSSTWVHPAGGGWRRQASRSAYGGSLLNAGGPLAVAGTSFFGNGFALVAPVGPERGSLELRVDGADWQVVDLHARKAQPRRVVFSQSLPRAAHEVQIRSLGDGKVAVDALLFLR